MGIVDDVNGGYETLAAFTGPDGEVNFERAYYSQIDDYLAGEEGGYSNDDEEEDEEDYDKDEEDLSAEYARLNSKEKRALVLREGAQVVLRGLKGAQCNSRQGTLVQWLADKGRWVVSLADSGENSLLKPENLELAAGEVIGEGGDVLIIAELAPDPAVWDHCLHAGLSLCGMRVELLEACDAPFASLARNLRQFRCLVLLG
eukprot:CAMPEP_0117650372 /NCGR_PEP_ID=MMETSP0804-20121206/1504_1 /TAXON_ID=1074897 /ORGANISM="Tetraselmis astigmatica, Strain CCMP880" /LENGTH=201 /DNA_ID=CAMNT_0005456239 /DNA_START=15 /DNA_END=617 /DNA_ORIENTATION=+